MIFTIIFVNLVGTLVASASIAPELNQNQLRFPWGVNFKYNGMLHYNLARVWIVTKIPLPKPSEFNFPSFNFYPDCNFNTTFEGMPNELKTYKWVRPWLRSLCETSLPIISLLRKKEDFYKNKLQDLLTNELHRAMPALGSAGRPKRFASVAIPAIAGLVTLAVESVSGFLQNRRNKAMAKAMDAFHSAHRGLSNRLYRYEDDLLLYGTFSLNMTHEIIASLKGIYYKQSSLEGHIRVFNQKWPHFYLSTILGSTLYTHDLQLYIHGLSQKFEFFYNHLIDNLNDLIRGVNTLSKGHLPPELFPPSLITNFTETVKQELIASVPGHTLALDHISQYYDNKLATFGIDRTKFLVVAFPILIKPIKAKHLTQYEIETVPVPVTDTDTAAGSYSGVQISKPYIATTDNHYIQLRIQELCMCKNI